MKLTLIVANIWTLKFKPLNLENLLARNLKKIVIQSKKI